MVEEWLEIADIIADPETGKKERMVQAKGFGTHLGKNKVSSYFQGRFNYSITI